MSAKLNVAPFIVRSGVRNPTFRVSIERSGFIARQGGFTSLDEAIAWRDEKLKLAPPPHSKPPVRVKKPRLAYTMS